MPSEFYKLWDLLPHPRGSVVRLFARGGDRREGDFARNADEIKMFARAFEDLNVYVAPNPTRSTRGTRHTAAEVSHWSYFLIDMDPVCACPADRKPDDPKCATCRGEHDAAEALAVALRQFDAWTGRPAADTAIIIDSGRGRQAWIPLDTAELDETVQTGLISYGRCTRATARRTNGYWLKRLDEKLGLQYGCKIDTSVADLPRVMRCPGTLNQKTKRRARIVWPGTAAHSTLAGCLVGSVPAKDMADPEPVEGVAPGTPWQMVFSHLTLSAQNYLTYGKAEPGRHKVAFHTARKMYELGVSRGQARKALQWANELQGEDQELDPSQIEHALDTAFNTENT